MVDTARTTSYLVGTSFPDGQPAGNIHPQNFRDLTVSTPQWDAVGGVAAPGILRGFVELGDYVTRNGGTVGAGQVLATRQTNATQVQNAFNYAATNNKFLEFAPNTIEIDNTAGILLQSQSFNAFRLYGSKGSSVLAQFHTGAPVMVLGPTDTTSINDLVIDGMSLTYSGSSSTGNVLQIGYIYLSRVANIDLNGTFAVANLIYAGDPANAGVLPFSNHFDNISGARANASFIWCNATSTGSKWTNIYFSNSNPGASPLSAPAIYWGVNGAAPDETTFEQLNVEHVQVSAAMFVNGGSAAFIGCHWEDIQLTGSNPIFWRIAGGSKTNISIIGGTTTDLGLNSGLMTGTATYFSYFDDVMISMRGHYLKATGSPPVTRNMPVQMFSGGPDGLAPSNIERTMCKINDTRFDSSYYGFMSLDGGLPRATYGDLELVDGYLGGNAFPRIGGRVVIDDPPNNAVIYGALGSNVIVRYIKPIAGNMNLTLATVLVSGGSLNRPALDQVSVIRESSCTGAFTITVNNAAASPIGAAFTTTSSGTSKIYIHTTTAGTWTQTI